MSACFHIAGVTCQNCFKGNYVADTSSRIVIPIDPGSLAESRIRQLEEEVERLKGIEHEFKMLQASALREHKQNKRYREALESIAMNEMPKQATAKYWSKIRKGGLVKVVVNDTRIAREALKGDEA